MAALVVDDGSAVWSVGLDGSDPQELYRAEGCNTMVGDVDPGGARVALTQTCLDPLERGALVVDLASGEPVRVTTGLTSAPRWSPDGEWLVFGYSRPGQGDGISTWIARADGDQLREVVPYPAWNPVWLPAG
jgi:hypothetical protein